MFRKTNMQTANNASCYHKGISCYLVLRLGKCKSQIVLYEENLQTRHVLYVTYIIIIYILIANKRDSIISI